MKQVDLLIPDKWEDITVKTYQKYVKLQESKIDEKKKIIKSVALLCNTTQDIVKKMNYNDLVDIMTILKNLVDAEPDQQNFRKTFDFNGDKYGFIPNLSKLTTGEYIDLETYSKEPIKNLHNIMSILYRKITFERNIRYAIEPYDPDQFKEELFKECPMDIALGSLGFFLTLGEKLATISLNYLRSQKTTQQEEKV